MEWTHPEAFQDGPVYQRPFLLLLVVTPLAVGGCAGLRQTAYLPRPCVPPQGVVFVADGAGNFLAASASLRQVAARDRLPLDIEAFPWSHGSFRCLADHMDYTHARVEGQCLAAQVVAFRQQCPGAEVYLLGHSAGCAVILAAAESLPPDYIDRVVLLAPSLSVDYDLRPTLRCARDGLDVFYSQKDWVYLALVTGIIGTSDRHWAPAGGRVGFRPHADGPYDSQLFSRLRQHPWQPSYAADGNRGGHYGSYQPDFLRDYVMPLLHRDSLVMGGGWTGPGR
jgi:pimeloyl-ACP methyl ester carboxylesterase